MSATEIRLEPDTNRARAVLRGHLCAWCESTDLDTGWECNDCGFDNWPLVSALPGFPWRGWTTAPWNGGVPVKDSD